MKFFTCGVRPKKICFSAPSASPLTPSSKTFIAFPILTLKFVYTSQIVSLSCHFLSLVCWLITSRMLHILKVRNFWKLLRCIFFIAFYSKNKNKKPPLIIFLASLSHVNNLISFFCKNNIYFYFHCCSVFRLDLFKFCFFAASAAN